MICKVQCCAAGGAACRCDFAAASVTLQRILLQSRISMRRAWSAWRCSCGLVMMPGQRVIWPILESRPLSPISGRGRRLAGSRCNRSVGADACRRHPVWGRSMTAIPDNGPAPLPWGAELRVPAEGLFGGFGELAVRRRTSPWAGKATACGSKGHGFARGHVDDSRGHSYARLAAGPRIDLGFAFLDLMALAQAEFVGGHFYGSRLGGRAQLIVDVSDRISASVRVEAAHDRADVNLFSTTNVGDGDGWEFRPRRRSPTASAIAGTSRPMPLRHQGRRQCLVQLRCLWRRAGGSLPQCLGLSGAPWAGRCATSPMMRSTPM
jgi:hypothetical protein